MLLNSSGGFLISKAGPAGRRDWLDGSRKQGLRDTGRVQPMLCERCPRGLAPYWDVAHTAWAVPWDRTAVDGEGPRAQCGHRGLAPPLPGCDLELVTEYLASNSGLPHTS